MSQAVPVLARYIGAHMASIVVFNPFRSPASYDRQSKGIRAVSNGSRRPMRFSCVVQDAAPETNEDFERLVIASPNDSLIWVQYMAFKLSLADIDVSVRRVAGRTAYEKWRNLHLFRELMW